MQISKKQMGKLGEDAVKELYERHFFKILVRNFFNRRGKQVGEIDFIAQKNNHIHFVEIKTRTSESYGSALESITSAKKKRVVAAANYFLALFGQFREFEMHIDVATVQLRQFDKGIERITIYSDVIEET